MDTLTIILVIILTALGITAGYLIAVLRQHPSQPTDKPPTPEIQDAVEVVRIWRTKDNQLVLGMDGQQLDNAKTISPEQRRQLVKLVIDMRPWLEASSGTAPSGAIPGVGTQVREAINPSAVTAVEGLKAPEAEKPAPVVLKSIVGQIDDVLQKLLDTSPLKSQDLQLIEGPGGAVVVRIGLRRYEGIDAVPDPQVKELIRQAIAEWEKGAK